MMGQIHNWSTNILFLWNCIVLHQLTFKCVVIKDGIRLCGHKVCELKLHVRLKFWHPPVVWCSFPVTPKTFQIRCFACGFPSCFKNKHAETYSTVHCRTYTPKWTAGTAGASGSSLQISEGDITVISGSLRLMSLKMFDPHRPDTRRKAEIFARVISR